MVVVPLPVQSESAAVGAVQTCLMRRIGARIPRLGRDVADRGNRLEFDVGEAMRTGNSSAGNLNLADCAPEMPRRGSMAAILCLNSPAQNLRKSFDRRIGRRAGAGPGVRTVQVSKGSRRCSGRSRALATAVHPPRRRRMRLGAKAVPKCAHPVPLRRRRFSPVVVVIGALGDNTPHELWREFLQGHDLVRDRTTSPRPDPNRISAPRRRGQPAFGRRRNGS